MNSRISKITDLPVGVWVKESQTLLLPEALCSEYREMLKKHDLYETALDTDPGDGAVGGIKDEDTKNHFATRFSSSAARAQLALLDPNDELGQTRDTLLEMFSGGRIAVLDFPCGAGASSINLLATVAALRNADVVPRHPLEVCITLGDISDLARSYASEVFQRLRHCLELEGIYLFPEFVYWDVMDQESNTDLIYDWIERTRDCTGHFVLVSNFSDFLGDSGNFKRADKKLEEMFRWGARVRPVVLWIEPQTNKAKGLLTNLGEFFKKIPRLLQRDSAASTEAPQKSQSRYVHPVKHDSSPRVHLSLIRLEGTRR